MENDRGAKERMNERKRTRSITRTPFAWSRSVRIPRPQWCGASLQRVFYETTYHDERVDRVRPVAGCFAFVAIGEHADGKFRSTQWPAPPSRNLFRCVLNGRYTQSRSRTVASDAPAILENGQPVDTPRYQTRYGRVPSTRFQEIKPIRICGSPWRVGNRRCLAAFPQTGLNSLLEN